MSISLYQTPLATQEFRLLRICAGYWLDDLKGELYKANKLQKYTALSYTWGSGKRTHKIIVNGLVHRITFNLDRALRTFRRQDEEIVIWVDSICINQESIQEKSQQVGLMHDIFSWAHTVNAYVGDSLDRSHPSYNQHFNDLGEHPNVHFSKREANKAFIEEHLFDVWKNSPKIPAQRANGCLFSLLAVFSHLDLTQRLNDEGLLRRDHLDRAKDEKIRYLLERLRLFVTSPWWDRIWVVQEVGVANELMITYGRLSMQFSVLQNAVLHLTTQQPELLRATDNEVGKVFSYFVTKVNSIIELRAHQRQSPNARYYELDYLPRSGGSPLLWLLRTFRNRRSSEPRDKIFALVQLLKSFSAVVQPLMIVSNYGGSVRKLFSEVTIQIIKNTGMIWMTSSDLLSKSRSDLPSWVPDWSNEIIHYGPSTVKWKVPWVFNTSGSYFCDTTDGQTDGTVRAPLRHCSHLDKRPGYTWTSSYGDVWSPRLFTFSPSQNRTRQRYQAQNHESTWQFEDGDDGTGYGLELRAEMFRRIVCIGPLLESDLSNVSDMIAWYIDNCPGLPRNAQDEFWWETPYKEPIMDVIGRALCYGVLLSESTDGVCRIEPNRQHDISAWVLQSLSRYLGPHTRGDVLPDPELLIPESLSADEGTTLVLSDQKIWSWISDTDMEMGGFPRSTFLQVFKHPPGDANKT